MWDDILGHEQNKEFLARLLQPGNRPHALLFYGPEGIGKKQLALRFAKTFLCQKPDEHPCGRCESCRLINLAEHSFAHPDFILVEQEAPGKDLKIEQIKEMSRQTAFAPALSSHKVCVIDAADRMTVEAANSLLKLLEEPPPNWMFILVASRLERLLPTILSRVIQLRFDQIPLALTQEALNRLGLERPELLALVIKICFQQRRKQLGSIARRCPPAPWLSAAIEQAGITPTLRPEQLTVADFQHISRFGASLLDNPLKN